MNPGLRVAICVVILLFLILGGLLGGLQDLGTSFIEDPERAAEIGAVIFPVEGIASAQPYKAIDLRKRFASASVYYKSTETPSDGVLMIVSTLRREDFDPEGAIDRGLHDELDDDTFEPVGAMRRQAFQFRQQRISAEFKQFQNPAGDQRSQFVLQFDWGDRLVFVTVNGPAADVSAAAVQAALDRVEGEAQPLLTEEKGAGAG